MQPESSHLFAYRDYKIFGDYHHSIREELLIIEHDPYAAVMETRAFQPEWALLLHRATGGMARLEVRRARTLIWERLWEEKHAFLWRRLLTRNKPVGFTVFEGSVRLDTADAIARVWETFLRETRYPPPTDAVCFDCSSQHFSLAVDGEGLLTGSMHGLSSWCSRMGELLDLVYLLRRFAVLPENTRPREQEILERVQMLADPAKLEARISECEAEHAARPNVDERARNISRHLEELAEWQYCFCGHWPASGADLKFFDDLHVAQRRRGDVPDARPYFPDFDFSSAKLSSEPDGPLRISVPGYERISPVPECFDLPRDSADELLGPDHCPRSPSKELH